jgi:hypothetical protein
MPVPSASRGPLRRLWRRSPRGHAPPGTRGEDRRLLKRGGLRPSLAGVPGTATADHDSDARSRPPADTGGFGGRTARHLRGPFQRTSVSGNPRRRGINSRSRRHALPGRSYRQPQVSPVAELQHASFASGSQHVACSSAAQQYDARSAGLLARMKAPTRRPDTASLPTS